LWAETYDRRLTDIFAVETEVAQRIATSLEAKLTCREKEAISHVGTKIPAAYDAFLRGIALRNTQTREDQERLLQFCREAVALDPDYAAAWAEIAFAEGLKYLQGGQSEAQRARVHEAAEKALRLDPEHGSGHAAWGTYLYYCLQEYDKALIELELARQQAPNDAVIILATGLVKRRQGKLDESIELLLQAAQLDPRNQDIWSNLGQTYRGMRKLGEARAMFDRALAIAPNDRALLAQKAGTYMLEGDFETGIRLFGEIRFSFMSRGYRRAIATLQLQRQYDTAIAEISADLEKEKSPAPFLLAIAHLTLGALHIEAGRKSQGEPLLLQAEGELEDLRNQGNTSPDLLGSLLHVKARLGKREEVERLGAEFIARQAKDRWGGGPRRSRRWRGPTCSWATGSG
ncbi:MAG: tetratricopeptide repeat protein, partial [Verrucomicrobiota bacterium]|nr:tetratricopeptide repeat protein [Verrucomicrobiota bacterium]